jgi:hypothetical protein
MTPAIADQKTPNQVGALATQGAQPADARARLTADGSVAVLPRRQRPAAQGAPTCSADLSAALRGWRGPPQQAAWRAPRAARCPPRTAGPSSRLRTAHCREPSRTPRGQRSRLRTRHGPALAIARTCFREGVDALPRPRGHAVVTAGPAGMIAPPCDLHGSPCCCLSKQRRPCRSRSGSFRCHSDPRRCHSQRCCCRSDPCGCHSGPCRCRADLCRYRTDMTR